MSNLFEFVDFGDNNPTSATPSGRLRKKSTTITTIDVEVPAPKSPEPKRKREPKSKGESKPEPKVEPEIKCELSTNYPIYDNSITDQYVRDFFKPSEKVGKDNLICYGDKKTMFGGNITALDKVKEVGIINADHADGSRFISTSFKLITESEIPQLIKKYTTVGAVRNYPLLVAIQYMEDPKYNNIRIRIQDEFL